MVKRNKNNRKSKKSIRLERNKVCLGFIEQLKYEESLTILGPNL